MYVELMKDIFALSNILAWRVQLIGIISLFLVIEVLLIALIRRLEKKEFNSNINLLDPLLRSLVKGMFFFCFSLILFTLQRSLQRDTTVLFLNWVFVYGLLNLGIIWVLLSFTTLIFKSKTLNQQVTGSIKKIVKISHRGINRSILIGVLVLYTRMLWRHVPLPLKSEFWVITIVITNALIMALVLFFALQKIFPLLVGHLEKKDPPSKTFLNLVKSTIGPLKILIFSLFLFMVKDFIQGNEKLISLLDLLLRLSFSIALLLFIYKLTDSILSSLSKFSESEDNSLDKTLFEMLRMITGIIFIAILAIILIKIITGKELTTLLAGLGIGGLALALAAQDTLKNFFGSIMIMTDKPFKIGERIIAEGFDGTIESIGFRSTRIRTLTGNLVIIPNDKVAQASVENIGKRLSIRRLSNITITYDTPPEKIERALEILRNILENHQGMQEDFPPRIHFNEFNSDSLNIQMIYWYFPPNYWDFLSFTEKVNIQIMKDFAAEGIEFAFPTQTTYLEQADGKSIKLSIEGNPLGNE